MPFQSTSPRLWREALTALILFIALCGWPNKWRPGRLPSVHAASGQSEILISTPRSLEVRYHGKDAAVRSLQPNRAVPLSLATDDFDQDGVADLVVGYSTDEGGRIAIHRGNLDAFAPQSDASFRAIARSQFPSPFLPDAQVIEAPAVPDFLVAGRFQGVGSADLALAARGGHRLYVMSGNGKGQFGPAQAVELPGAVTAMAAVADGLYSRVLVGVHVGTASMLLEFKGSHDGLSPLRRLSLPADAASFASGNLDGDRLPDAAIVAGGSLFVLRGSGSAVETVATPFTVSSVALGSFVFNRNPGLEIAALATDGSLHIFAREGFNSTPYTAAEFEARRRAALSHTRTARPPVAALAGGLVWNEIESVPGVVDGAGAPLLLKTRISNQGADDAMILSHERLAVVGHPDGKPGDTGPFPPAFVSRRNESIEAPVTALAARVNVDGRPGVVYLSRGALEPQLMMPRSGVPTFTVNTTTDLVSSNPNACADSVSGQCSLREAVIEANAAGVTETIMIPAGTYTLTIARAGTPTYDATNGALDVTNSVNIVGASAATTIIQGGSVGVPGTPNGVDKVFAFNQDAADTTPTNATVSISNVTIENGYNQGSTLGRDGYGGGFFFDTGANGTATLSVTSVILSNNTLIDGGGAGFALANYATGAGSATFSNCTVENNATVPGPEALGAPGGGGYIFDDASMTMTNCTVSGNQASAANSDFPQGGGLAMNTESVQVAIHASTISENQAASQGGGVFAVGDILIDQGSVISGNTSSSDGGGLWLFNGLDASSVSGVTFTGNAAGANGGGIYVEGGSGGALTVSFSRLAGNTADTGANLAVRSGSTGVTAQDNWWGTNSPGATIEDGSGSPATSNCPAATAQVCFAPYIVLTNTASPTTIASNGSSTLTGSLATDSNSTTLTTGDLAALSGVSITFGNPVLGTISETQPESLNSNAQATATYNGAGSGGSGSADATVDQQTVTANISLTAPPVITQVPGTTSMLLGLTTTLQFEIQNNNVSQSLSGIGFTDTLPSNLVVATPSGLTGSCGGGTITSTAASSVISLSGATLAALASCSFTVSVTSVAAGSATNTTGTVTSTEGGPGAAYPVTISVVAPPTLGAAFSPTSMTVSGTSTLTFTLGNPTANTVAETEVTFTNTFPTGLTIANPNGLSGTCGGMNLAIPGSSSMIVASVSIATNSTCTVSVNVVASATGSYTDTTGNVNSTSGGLGLTASANLTVASPPSITKSFGGATVPLNGTTSLTFAISNPNSNVTITGIAFTDSLPSGMVVAATPGLSNTCGGTPSATAAGGVVSLSGGSLTSGGSCTVSLNVEGTAAGVLSNSVQVTSTNAGTGNTSTVGITVVAPPTILQSGATSIPLHGSTSLTFEVENNNNSTQSLSGVGFTDTLPSDLIVSTPNGLTGSCGGGTITATAGTGVISLSGATLAASAVCTFEVSVTDTAAGTATNSTGPVASNEGGSGGRVR